VVIRKEVWHCQQFVAGGRADDVVIKCDVRNLIENEVRALHYLSRPGHPNIVPLLHSFICASDPERLYMVMPYYPKGDLLDVINDHAVLKMRISKTRLLSIFQPIFSAVEYCHKRGVAHMDISPEQIWFDARGVPVLGDFDAIFVPRQALIRCNWRRGKSSFMCPEMVLLAPLDPFAADIFSLGCTLFTTAAKLFLLECVDVYDVKSLTERKCYKMLTRDPDFGSFELVHQTAPSTMCHNLKDLVARMTVCNPKHRITMNGIKNHEWLRLQTKVCPTKRPREHQPSLLRVVPCHGFSH
jgi:serine/threonine protein kinase